MIKKNTIDEVIDLSEHFVVLGSGLNAISTIHGILDNYQGQVKKIYVVDAGLTKKSNPNALDKDSNFKMPSPKFKVQDNVYTYAGFKKMLHITESGFQAIGSLAKGGLSNIWGAGIQPYNEKELSKFPYSYKEIKESYLRIYQILTNLDFSSALANYEEHNNHNHFGFTDPLLAFNQAKGNKDSCYLESCNNGCINCNKGVFNSKNEIDDFINLNKIEYMPGLFIESITSEDSFFFIKCLCLSSKKLILIKTSAIYCCLGTISTSKIVLGMSKKENTVPLLTTPGGSFFIYSYKKYLQDHQILSSKTFKGCFENNNFEGNIIPFSKNLLCTYFGEYLGSFLNLVFGRLLFSKLFIANIFFDSDLSSTIITKNDNKLKIVSSINPNLKIVFKETMKIVKKEFFKEGLLIAPLGKKLLVPGQDIHYGGSIPMKADPEENQCDFNGQLNGYNNFYIADASSMPFLASKGQSFNSMVNAYYIASKSIKNKIID